MTGNHAGRNWRSLFPLARAAALWDGAADAEWINMTDWRPPPDAITPGQLVWALAAGFAATVVAYLIAAGFQPGATGSVMVAAHHDLTGVWALPIGAGAGIAGLAAVRARDPIGAVAGGAGAALPAFHSPLLEDMIGVALILVGSFAVFGVARATAAQRSARNRQWRPEPWSGSPTPRRRGRGW